VSGASTTPAAAGEAMARWLEWLGDLATYRPGDFLMFSPRTYWRLFELHNEAWWPLPWLLPAIGAAMLAWAWRGGDAARRAGALALAAASGFVGWAFMLERYAPVNWAATGLAVLWGALCLSLLALAASGQVRVGRGGPRRRAATVLVFWALLGQPLLAPLAGRPLAQAEVFGLAPDPTAIAVIAWLLAGSMPARGAVVWAWRTAWALAAGACLIGAATLAVLDEWQAGVPLAAAVAGLVLARARPRPPGVSPGP